MRLGHPAAIPGATAILAATLALAAGAAPLGLPRLPAAQPGAEQQARADLGRRLFMDRRLSRNGTMSCGMCHVPEQGFAAAELATAVGMEGRSLRRNAPTVLNVSHQAFLFHDGRETSLEGQVWGPLLAQDEMANGTREAAAARVQALPEYGALFARAFPGQDITPAAIESALAAYERTLESGNSRFDRFEFAGERDALTAQEQLGLALFRGKAGCSLCHTIGAHDALLTDRDFHNTGIGFARAQPPPANVQVPLAPGVHTELTREQIADLITPESVDYGRFEVTGAERDRFAYKTPSLRNVALTAPYMHDGSLATLERVVEFYDRGGADNPGKDPRLLPLGLTGAEKAALAAFLRSLTGDNVEQLAGQARAAAPAVNFR